MELTSFKDFQKLSSYSNDECVWFVDIPIIEKGDYSYELDCPLVKGRLKNVGWNHSNYPYRETIMFEEIPPYRVPDDELFRHTFNIWENDRDDLKGRKIFTKEREALKYHNKIQKAYQDEIDELNSKYVIKMSDICDKFGIDKTESNKVIILKYN